MTLSKLFLWIISSIGLQVALFLAVSLWRRWTDYRALTRMVAQGKAASPPAEASEDKAAATPAWKGFRGFKVVRKDFEGEAKQVCSFYLEPADRQPLPSFLPGQFLTLRFDVPTSEGVGQLVRCYSLSCAPNRDYYRISVKRATMQPAATSLQPCASAYLHDSVKVGDILQVRAPSGQFHLDDGTAPVVLIAGGIGITPMLSMLEWIAAQQPQREAWLFYGVRDRRELIMARHLDALASAHPNIRIQCCFSSPPPLESAADATVVRSRVTIELLRNTLPLKPYDFYLCGPAAMLQSLVPALEDWGVPDSRIHFEAFGPASIPRRSSLAAESSVETAEEIRVTFAKSGKSYAWQPAAGSLLEFAERQGLAPESSCRSGSCGTCQTKIREGDVRYLQPPGFDPEPGNCLLCVCVPTTQLTLEA